MSEFVVPALPRTTLFESSTILLPDKVKILFTDIH